MLKKMVAYCGLVCTECPAYIAERTDDDALRAKTAVRWSRSDFSVSPEEVSCDGCVVTEGTQFKHCELCEVRGCAASRGVATCAECPDYACAGLEERLSAIIGPGARETLDRLVAGPASRDAAA